MVVVAVVEIASSAFQKAVVVYRGLVSVFENTRQEREKIVLCVESRTRYR